MPAPTPVFTDVGRTSISNAAVAVLVKLGSRAVGGSRDSNSLSSLGSMAGDEREPVPPPPAPDEYVVLAPSPRPSPRGRPSDALLPVRHTNSVNKGFYGNLYHLVCLYRPSKHCAQKGACGEDRNCARVSRDSCVCVCVTVLGVCV